MYYDDNNDDDNNDDYDYDYDYDCDDINTHALCEAIGLDATTRWRAMLMIEWLSVRIRGSSLVASLACAEPTPRAKSSREHARVRSFCMHG